MCFDGNRHFRLFLESWNLKLYLRTESRAINFGRNYLRQLWNSRSIRPPYWIIIFRSTDQFYPGFIWFLDRIKERIPDYFVSVYLFSGWILFLRSTNLWNISREGTALAAFSLLPPRSAIHDIRCVYGGASLSITRSLWIIRICWACWPINVFQDSLCLVIEGIRLMDFRLV